MGSFWSKLIWNYIKCLGNTLRETFIIQACCACIFWRHFDVRRLRDNLWVFLRSWSSLSLNVVSAISGKLLQKVDICKERKISQSSSMGRLLRSWRRKSTCFQQIVTETDLTMNSSINVAKGFWFKRAVKKLLSRSHKTIGNYKTRSRLHVVKDGRSTKAKIFTAEQAVN